MTHFVTRNNKSDRQAHSRSLVFTIFDRLHMIFKIALLIS